MRSCYPRQEAAEAAAQLPAAPLHSCPLAPPPAPPFPARGSCVAVPQCPIMRRSLTEHGAPRLVDDVQAHRPGPV